FPDGGGYFSRTLAASGPLQKLRGSSGWRDFSLPFTSKPGYFPRQLRLMLVLEGKGKVAVGPLQLMQSMPSGAGAWWGERTAGWVFGGLGSLIGCMGALIGI